MLLRGPLLAAGRSRRLGELARQVPGSRGLVDRFVAGLDADDALQSARTLVAQGLKVSLDHLGEDTTDLAMVAPVVDAYRALLTLLHDSGLAGDVEVSVKLTALGLDLDAARALAAAGEICAAAAKAGTTVTVDMEDHTRTDATLAAVRELRTSWPWVGAVVQAYLHRTEGDCADLTGEGSRVRLCKGAYEQPASVAYRTKAEVDASYLRCLGVLARGAGYPMVASHDPTLLAAAGELLADRAFEYQLLFGVRPAEQRRLADAGATVRVYTPYGSEWYGYLMRRLAERPANVRFFLRSLTSQS